MNSWNRPTCHTAKMIVCAWLCVHALPRARGILLAPSSTGSDAYPLVLCTGLDSTVSTLRELELSAHEVGLPVLESQCVYVNPCTQQSFQHDTFEHVPINTWIHGNASALRLSAPLSDSIAHNYGSFEYARVPEGLRLETCAPDFDLWRRTGQIVCNDLTIRTINADNTSRACPGSTSFSLLDCMRPIQHDSSTQLLVMHYGAMHFGSQLWTDVCPALMTSANSSSDVSSTVSLGAQICRDTAAYSVNTPVAAGIGSTSLIRFSFLPGYGCHDAASLASSTSSDEHTERLSRIIPPNQKIQCPRDPHGTYAHDANGLECQLTCNDGFVSTEQGCTAACALGRNLQPVCNNHFHAVYTCVIDDVPHYECQECPTQTGVATMPWSSGNPTHCAYTPCLPGHFGQDHECVACARNTYAPEGASACTSCDTLHTGLYQPLTGQSSCTQCLGHAGSATDCNPGHEFVHNFTRMHQLYTAYSSSDANIKIQNFVAAYCNAGFACLPCETGTLEIHHVCHACDYATYNPNYGATICFDCAHGQNTSTRASISKTACVCIAGYE